MKRKKIKNSLQIKIVSFFAIAVLGVLQWYSYSTNKDKVLRFSDFVTFSSEVVSYSDFESISFKFYNRTERKEVILERKISNNYDPFIRLKVGDKISLTYDKGKEGVFYIDGYEDKPSRISFYSTFLLVLIAQLGFFAMILDKLDERHLSYEK